MASKGIRLVGGMAAALALSAAPAGAADNSKAMEQHMRLMAAGNPGMMQMMVAPGGMGRMDQAPPFDQMPNTNHP